MLRLRPLQPSFNTNKAEISKRNGLRHNIYSPKVKGLHQEYYKGKWKNDKREGKGMNLDRDGWMYEGDWLNNRKHGYGVLSKVSEDGSIHKCYAGNWVFGKKHGYGSNWYEDGSYYEGTFYQNARQGEGRIWYSNGDYYQGNWNDDLHEGQGMFIQADGNRYEGQFVRGKKEGPGIFYHLDSGQMQRGIWRNDICVYGTIEDTYWRQSALHATPYPIPINQLANWNNTFESWTTIGVCKSTTKEDSPDNMKININACKYPCNSSKF